MSKKEGGLQFEWLQKILKKPKTTTKEKNPSPTAAWILGRRISLPTMLYISDKSKYVQITSDVPRKTTLSHAQRILF